MTIETEESVVLRGSPTPPSSIWCPVCRRRVEMITPELAAQIADVSLRTIYRWVEASTIHFVEGGGISRICASALHRRNSYAM